MTCFFVILFVPSCQAVGYANPWTLAQSYVFLSDSMCIMLESLIIKVLNVPLISSLNMCKHNYVNQSAFSAPVRNLIISALHNFW